MRREDKDKLVQKYIEITKNDTIMNNWASRARPGLRLTLCASPEPGTNNGDMEESQSNFESEVLEATSD